MSLLTERENAHVAGEIAVLVGVAIGAGAVVTTSATAVSGFDIMIMVYDLVSPIAVLMRFLVVRESYCAKKANTVCATWTTPTRASAATIATYPI